MNYIALTIGPIYKTLKNAKKTRELWGGSYMFSYIMKNIIQEFKNREFVVPYIDEHIFESGKEVGLFHDRFIFKAQEGDFQKLEERIDTVLSDFAQKSKIDKTYLKNYLQINFIEKELDEEVNPIIELTPYLDAQELFFQTFQNDKNLLEGFLRDPIKVNKFLVQDAFGTKRKSFPSLPEIAMYDLKKNFDIASMLKDDELEVYEDKLLKDEVKPYHKYIAIVHADGDSMGKVVESLKSQTDFNAFSKNLFDYCSDSHALIKGFGGQTIFAGGDDLLFFAPVVNDKKTIFNLCEEISERFNTIFQNYTTTPKPTLSFGVSITYYKFPLYEALESSRNLLFGKAKNEVKNNIAFSVTKHSGQTFESVIHKGNKEVYDNFLVFTSNIDGSEDMDNFLHSIHHKIDTYRTTIDLIGKDKDRLKNFFDNYFNEEVHKSYRSFFEALIDFIHVVYSDDKIKKDEKLKLIYASLRFIKFIKGDKA